jgi:hypothetical protein
MSARGAIENVLNRYSIAYDDNDMAEMADTFTEDAVLSMRIADGRPHRARSRARRP